MVRPCQRILSSQLSDVYNIHHVLVESRGRTDLLTGEDSEFMRRYLCNCEMGEWPYQSHNITSTRISALTNCFNLSSFLQNFFVSLRHCKDIWIDKQKNMSSLQMQTMK